MTVSLKIQKNWEHRDVAKDLKQDNEGNEGCEDNCEVDFDSDEGYEAGPGLGLVAGG